MRFLTNFYFDHPGFTHKVPLLQERLQTLLAKGAEFLYQQCPLNSAKFSGTSVENDIRSCIFGLTTLGVRQAQTIVFLGESGYGDQTLGLSRSLYETLVNQRSIAADASGHLAAQFIDYQSCANKRYHRSLLDQTAPEAQSAKDAVTGNAWLSSTIESEWDTYQAKYPGLDPKSWTSTDLVARAQAAGVGLRWIYQWLCGYTHGSIGAVRNLFSGHGDSFELEPRDRADFVAWFTLFCLASILELGFRTYDHIDHDVDAIILWASDPETYPL